MTRGASRRLVRVLLPLCICVSLEAGGVRAQSGRSGGATTGQIILIDPAQPKGKLKVLQENQRNPVDATQGMPVRRGDLLILDPEAKAAIQCGGRDKPVPLKPGRQGCPCAQACAPEICGTRYDGGVIASTRGGDTTSGAFPMIISPRRGLVLNTRPTIRWAPIAGAKREQIYTVSLYGENQKLVWTREVTAKTEIAYPDNAPALTPGHVYLPIVTAELTSSEDEGVPNRGFTIITADKAKALSKKATRIKDLKLPEAQTRLLTAYLYAAKELYSEAVALLESPKCIDGPATKRMLGDLYLKIGLNREAERRYLEALKLEPENELEERALILSGLGWAYENLGSFDLAAQNMTEAINAYEKLGDSAMARRLKQEIERLKG